MADEDKSIASNRLMDVLGLLGAGGLAKGAATVAAKGAPSLGMFFTPAQFARVLKQNPNQPMHPAVWENLSGTGRARLGEPSSPEAMKVQSDLDNYVMSTPNILRSNDWLFHNTGWSRSPLLGRSREVSDTGATVTKHEDSTVLNHPLVNLHQLFNIAPARTNYLFKPRAAFYFPSRNEIELGSDSSNTQNVLHEFTHAGQQDADLLRRSYRPGDLFIAPTEFNKFERWTPQDLMAVAKRHANPYYEGDIDAFTKDFKKASEDENLPALTGFRNTLGYFKRAHEVEPVNVEDRFNNPELYKQTPESTQMWPTYLLPPLR